jgi:hypothetical protein
MLQNCRIARKAFSFLSSDTQQRNAMHRSPHCSKEQVAIFTGRPMIRESTAAKDTTGSFKKKIPWFKGRRQKTVNFKKIVR